MCPRIIKDKSNNFSNILKGKQAAISSFLEGISIEHIKPSHCAELGTMVAKFHNASNELEIYRENDLGVKKLETIIESIEHKSHNWCMGIQWHPEFLITKSDQKIISNFINSTK